MTVTADSHAYEALASVGTPVLRVGSASATARLVSGWGLIEAGDLVQTDVSITPVADPVSLGDLFVPIRHRLTDVQRGLPVVRGDNLTVETITQAGKNSVPTSFHFDGRTLYWSTDMLDEGFLHSVGLQFGLHLDVEEIEAAVRGRSEAGKRQLVLRIREQETVEEKLLAAVGADVLGAHLSAGLLQAVEATKRKLTGRRLGELALAVYGFDALKEFTSELRERGLNPPDAWSGSSRAVEFAHQLGFPRDYAGFENVKRPPLLEVEGPVDLPELHEFQLKIVSEVRRLVRGEGGRRGLISLPTGAGKTRVAVQALVEAIKDGDITRPVLWVAQSDELNEQAVQTWSEVWRALGSADLLSVSRLWSSNDAEPVDRGAHVVIATIDKLQGCVADTRYEWLSEPACVVLDEAHHAITPEYTKLLSWVGVSRTKAKRPLLGLTATPFRGVSKDETTRLAKRFGQRRLDEGCFDGDPYLRLQEMGSSRTGTPPSTKRRGRRPVPRRASLPSAIAPLACSCRGAHRSQHSPKQTPCIGGRQACTLFHRAPVCHVCRALADNGSASKLGRHPCQGNFREYATGCRRRAPSRRLERREFRVFTNYNVLTQGFDAPAVEAIFVARPTYSPNLYQQMIGRGLRGPW